jgi:glycosyltransferase involved in cell wall biosynthesis
MYLIPITVPIYKDGAALSVTTDWMRALKLLRDSFEGRYGVLCVAAPWLDRSESQQATVGPTKSDGIELVPLHPESVGLLSYWRQHHRASLAKVAALLPNTQVVHGTVEDSLRPHTHANFMAGVRAGKPTVFFQDQDVPSVVLDLSRGGGFKQRALAHLYARSHERQCRQAIAQAGLSFLKGEGTLKRYAGLSPHIHGLDDTSYLTSEMAAPDQVAARLSSLMQGQRPLRLVSCGRLVNIKGVDRSLRIVARARAQGANLTLDVLGGGPEADALQALAQSLGLTAGSPTPAVTFHGAQDYGAALLSKLATFDALLFNPRMEETPRVIFDGYAAGLPLLADGIPYVLERDRQDRAVRVLPRDDEEGASAVLVALAQDRRALAGLTHAALKAGEANAAERWYAKRAELTHAMVARHRSMAQRAS